MKNERHWLLAADICSQPEVLFSQSDKLEWAIFKTGRNSLIIVCTPKDENTAFIPVLQFWYRLFPNERSAIKKYLLVPQSHILERAITISATLSEDFSGRINICASVDSYPPLQTDVTWSLN